MTAQLQRRWFRFGFSLRTLFVAITVLGVWLGWELHTVRHRKALLAELQAATDEGRCYLEIDAWGPEYRHRFDYARVPRFRRLLGDKSVLRLYVPRSIGAARIAHVEQVFPEAELRIYGTEFRNIYGYRDAPIPNQLSDPQAKSMLCRPFNK